MEQFSPNCMEKHAGVNGSLFVLVRIEVSPREAQPHLKHIAGKKFLSFSLLYSVAQLAWIRFIFITMRNRWSGQWIACMGRILFISVNNQHVIIFQNFLRVCQISFNNLIARQWSLVIQYLRTTVDILKGNNFKIWTN